MNIMNEYQMLLESIRIKFDFDLSLIGDDPSDLKSIKAHSDLELLFKNLTDFISYMHNELKTRGFVLERE